jgi:hypothetical protein
LHFLANSVVGPSIYTQPPTHITYNEVGLDDYPNEQPTPPEGVIPSTYSASPDSACWAAFRANQYVLPRNSTEFHKYYGSYYFTNTRPDVQVTYRPECSAYKMNATVEEALNERTWNGDDPVYGIGDCTMAQDISCVFGDALPKQCRMNVRMQAAFILTGCLFLKAIYMIIVNYRARSRTKEHCLTFGDVVVASVINPDLKIYNECLLNSGEGNRHQTAHTCHKHCKDETPSETGDSIGHCQKCSRYNIVDKAADLPHPSIAIKYKKSLIGSLGTMAVTQIMMLALCCLFMIGGCALILHGMVSMSQFNKNVCEALTIGWENTAGCQMNLTTRLKLKFGTWGGFSSSVTLYTLPPDKLSSEVLAFTISNGPQFVYSLLYLILIYNLSLVRMEHEWGRWETTRKKPRCTIVSGKGFEESYFMQLPGKLLVPLMIYASLMHWMLGQAISTTEAIFIDPVQKIEHSIYTVRYFLLSSFVYLFPASLKVS